MASELMPTYKVVRFYESARIRRRVIATGLTLAEAQAHCNDPETSSMSATGYREQQRTRQLGRWFDGYEQER